jgi:Zn-finger nucleic acid-binding protein
MANECPNCRDKLLDTVNVDGYPVEVDHCRTCDGIWLDRGELERLLDAPEASLTVPKGAALGRRLCPRCTTAMYAFYYPKTFVTVDMCKRCQGLWLDKTEFQEMDAVRAFAARTGMTGGESAEAQERLTVKDWLLEFIAVNINAYKFWG